METIQLKKVEGVAAGGTATIELPIGNSYHQVLLNYAGVTLAQMTEIRVMADGNPVQRLGSGTQLDEMNQQDGRAAAAGTLTIDFERYGLRKKANQRLTVIGTGLPRASAAKAQAANLAAAKQGLPAVYDADPIQYLSLEIDIDGAAAAPAFASPKAQVSAPRPQGVLKRVEQFTYSPAGAGEFEISDLPRHGLINRIFFNASNINELRIETDRVTRFKRTMAENSLILGDGQAGRVVDANYFTVDFSEDGYGDEMMNVSRGKVNDLRFVLDMAGAATIPVIVEYIAPRAK